MNVSEKNDSSRGFTCVTCGHVSSRYNNLLRHYRQNPLHKPGNLRPQGRPSETADDVVSSFFSDNLAPGTRQARAKAFLSKLSDGEVKKYCLPRLIELIKPLDFLLESSKKWNGFLPVTSIASSLEELKDGLTQKYPEMKSHVYPTSPTCSRPTQIDTDSVLEFMEQNKKLTCKLLLDGKNEQSLFKEILMPMVYQKHLKSFLDFSSGLVGSLGISQRDMQDLLRNKWGRQIAEVLGINIFPPKDEVVKLLKAKKEALADQVGLTFEEKSNGVVVATVNVTKYLEYLLSRPGMQNAISFPNNSMLVYQFTDLAPWLKWSRFCSGLTTSRIKVVDPYNLHSLIITCGAYLGADDYETLRLCFKDLYDQILATNTIKVCQQQESVSIHVRCTADGKQRRLDTGNSTARSTYPICDAPEHCSQLGDMTLITSGPEWTVQETQELASNYKVWLNGKTDNAQNRREFAKLNLGNMGRENITGVDMKDYYIGGLHLALRSAETISGCISQCASGILGSSKQYLESLSKLARSVNKQELSIKFDEIGVLAFAEKMPKILEEAGFSGIILDILTTFTSGLNSTFTALLDTPPSLTGCQFECNARLLLGFQFVTIFGPSCVTPSIKQIVVHTSPYIDKAISDGNLIGTPLRFSNFSDGLMETAHKYAKQGTFLYSGGRDGCTSPTEYQKLILSQLFHNELNRLADREDTPSRSSEAKVSRKRQSDHDESYSGCVKKKKSAIPFEHSLFECKTGDLLNNSKTGQECTVERTKDKQHDDTADLSMQLGQQSMDERPEDNQIDDADLLQPDTTEETHSHLTLQDINALSTTTVPVPDNVKDHCDHLMHQILQSSREAFHSQKVFHVNKSSASEYSQSIKGETGVLLFHVDVCSINDEVIFQRTDPRVSKEILRCKFHLAPNKHEFTAEHHLGNSERQRVRFHFNHIMGMSLSGKALCIDICNAPIFERKLNAKCKWEADLSLATKSETATRWRIVVQSHESVDHLLPKLSRVGVLASALNISIRDDYPEFVAFAHEDPHVRFPVLKDPVLVRATQLAILKLSEEPRSRHDVQFLVQMYMGIEQAFRTLLQERLEYLTTNENHEE